MADDRHSNKSSRDVIAEYLGHETPSRIAADADGYLRAWPFPQAAAIGCLVGSLFIPERGGAGFLCAVGAVVQFIALRWLARGVVLLVFASARARREN